MSDRQARLRRIEAKRARAFRKKVAVISAFIVLVAALAAVYVWMTQPPPLTEAGNVVLVTNMGNITIELFDDMPITTGNFKNLTTLGVYDDTIFHRVAAGFVIQGGDPTGTGYGDPNIANIQDEFRGDQRNLRGTVAMANTGEPNSGSSQFFINLKYNQDLDGVHPVFGRVIAGMDVVDAISQVPVNNEKPEEPVVLVKAVLVP